MSVDLIPSDMVIRTNHPGWTAFSGELERGDTVTFNYEGLKRNLLVFENDGKHLKGIDKVRGGDFRCFLISKISNLQFAKPFVKGVPVTTVKFEMLPDHVNKLVCEKGKIYDFAFYNKAGEILKVYNHGDSIGLECYTKTIKIDKTSVTADEFRDLLNKFMAE